MLALTQLVGATLSQGWCDLPCFCRFQARDTVDWFAAHGVPLKTGRWTDVSISDTSDNRGLSDRGSFISWGRNSMGQLLFQFSATNWFEISLKSEKFCSVIVSSSLRKQPSGLSNSKALGHQIQLQSRLYLLSILWTTG